MMYPYSFFCFPNFIRYYNVPPNPHNLNYNYVHNPQRPPPPKVEVPVKDVCDNNTCDNNDENFFDFFGLKLAFDDLLILAVLFFLYKEETKDPYLYISLLLLLLS